MSGLEVAWRGRRGLLLPQVAEQSLSVLLSQPGGQQPSPLAQAVIAAWLHETLQLVALPVRTSEVQAMPSSQTGGTPGRQP